MLKKICPNCEEIYSSLDKSVCDRCGEELYFYIPKNNLYYKIKSLLFPNKVEMDVINELNQLHRWDYVFENYTNLPNVDKEKYFKLLSEIKKDKSNFKFLNKLRCDNNKHLSIYQSDIIPFIQRLDDEIKEIKSNNLEKLDYDHFIDYLNQEHDDKLEYVNDLKSKINIANSLKNLEYINYYDNKIELTENKLNELQNAFKDIELEINIINEFRRDFDNILAYFNNKEEKPSFFKDFKEKFLNLKYLDILVNFEDVSDDIIKKTRNIINIFNEINNEQNSLKGLKKDYKNFIEDFNSLIDENLNYSLKKSFLEDNNEFIDSIYSFKYLHILEDSNEIYEGLEFLNDFDSHWNELIHKHNELEEIFSLKERYIKFNDDWDVFLYQHVTDSKLKQFLLKWKSLKEKVFSFNWHNTKREDYKEAINLAKNIKFKLKNIDDFVEFSNAELIALKFIESSYHKYVSINDKENLIKNYQDFDISIYKYENLAKNLNFDLFNFENFKKIYRDFDNFVLKNNPEFVKREIKRFKWFFDNVNGYCLDKKQRIAVVTDEDNLEIVAGAGSGKTLTICANVSYLHKKGISYDDILCLSFSKAAAEDLSNKLPPEVKASTIHSLGASILKSHGKPSRADDGNVFNFTSKEIFLETILKDKDLFNNVIQYFTIYPYDIENSEKKSFNEIYDYKKGTDFKTLKQRYYGDTLFTYNKEKVKSVYELIIANFLFVNGIDYKYERYYNANGVLDYGYKPDFYLPNEDIYIEHFGLDCNCKARWLEEGSRNYINDFKYKVGLHKSNGTTLIKSYSCYGHKDILLSKLKTKLEENGVEFKEIDPHDLIEKIAINSELNSFEPLTSLIDTFLNRFKQNQFKRDKFDEFRKIASKEKSEYIKNRHMLFFDIAEKFYLIYEKKLKEWGKIDFNDMINNAIKEVKENGFKNFSYKYIIVDEFQDTSNARYQLIKEVQNCLNAKLIVVGDDWQSIYGFNGCNVSLFTEFGKNLENHKVLAIENTYRNSQNLIDIVGEFIQKNKKQILKNLHSKKANVKNPIKVAYHDYRIKNKVNSLELCIQNCSVYSNNIRILGRFNKTIYAYLGIKNGEYLSFSPFRIIDEYNGILTIKYLKNPSLNIIYSTIHKSKGLEEDNVILLGLEDRVFGFPSKITDDPILKYVDFTDEDFKMEEERRLFYVALTRTKLFNYLLVNENYKSEFFEELEEIVDYPLEVVVPPYNSGDVIRTDLKCPLCNSGDVLLKKNKNGNYYFKCSHGVCKWNGGFYNGDLNDLDYLSYCKNCDGINYIKKYFKNETSNIFVACSKNNKISSCYPSQILKNRFNKMNELFNEEILEISKIDDVIIGDYGEIFLKTGLKCRSCDDGEVVLKKSKNGNYTFLCSNCLWRGGEYKGKLNDLKYVRHCEICNGIEYATEEPYCSGTISNEEFNKFFNCSKSHRY